MAIKILSQLSIQVPNNLLHRKKPPRKQIPIIGISRLRLYDQENQTKKRKIGKEILQINLNQLY